jgi:hypothetical protein
MYFVSNALLPHYRAFRRAAVDPPNNEKEKEGDAGVDEFRLARNHDNEVESRCAEMLTNESVSVVLTQVISFSDIVSHPLEPAISVTCVKLKLLLPPVAEMGTQIDVPRREEDCYIYLLLHDTSVACTRLWQVNDCLMIYRPFISLNSKEACFGSAMPGAMIHEHAMDHTISVQPIPVLQDYNKEGNVLPIHLQKGTVTTFAVLKNVDKLYTKSTLAGTAMSSTLSDTLGSPQASLSLSITQMENSNRALPANDMYNRVVDVVSVDGSLPKRHKSQRSSDDSFGVLMRVLSIANVQAIDSMPAIAAAPLSSSSTPMMTQSANNCAGGHRVSIVGIPLMRWDNKRGSRPVKFEQPQERARDNFKPVLFNITLYAKQSLQQGISTRVKPGQLIYMKAGKYNAHAVGDILSAHSHILEWFMRSHVISILLDTEEHSPIIAVNGMGCLVRSLHLMPPLTVAQVVDTTILLNQYLTNRNESKWLAETERYALTTVVACISSVHGHGSSSTNTNGKDNSSSTDKNGSSSSSSSSSSGAKYTLLLQDMTEGNTSDGKKPSPLPVLLYSDCMNLSTCVDVQASLDQTQTDSWKGKEYVFMLSRIDDLELAMSSSPSTATETKCAYRVDAIADVNEKVRDILQSKRGKRKRTGGELV